MEKQANFLFVIESFDDSKLKTVYKTYLNIWIVWENQFLILTFKRLLQKSAFKSVYLGAGERPGSKSQKFCPRGLYTAY